jgi:hypothetical protein
MHIHTCVYTHLSPYTRTNAYAYMHTCIHACTFDGHKSVTFSSIHIHAYMHIHTCVYAYTHIHTCRFDGHEGAKGARVTISSIHIHAYMHMHTCVYAYTHMCTHINTYTHADSTVTKVLRAHVWHFWGSATCSWLLDSRNRYVKYRCKYVPVNEMQICTCEWYVYVNVRMHMYACMCTHVYVRMHMYACMCTHVYVRMYVYACIWYVRDYWILETGTLSIDANMYMYTYSTHMHVYDGHMYIYACIWHVYVVLVRMYMYACICTYACIWYVYVYVRMHMYVLAVLGARDMPHVHEKWVLETGTFYMYTYVCVYTYVYM